MTRWPPLRPFTRDPVPAPTGPESVAFDRRAIDAVGVPQPVLMENAGRAAATILARLHPRGRVVGVVGAGNNGGDALVALRTLLAWGWDASGIVVADRPAEEPLLHGWDLPLVRDDALDTDGWRHALDSADVVVDGILGTGVRGAPRKRQAEAIRFVNEAGRPVLAIDVPSGVDATTGATPGEAVRARVTVAFGAPKLGSLLSPARMWVGRLVAVDIGFPPSQQGEMRAHIATPTWARAQLPVRSPDTHKKAVGSVTVVAGRLGMAGAAVLAARAAFGAGAGLVRVCTGPENREVVQAAVPEAIWVDASKETDVRDAVSQSRSLAVGPGLGTDEVAGALLRAVLDGAALPTVLDADALNIAAAGGVDLGQVAAGRPLLVTPHPGEMVRLEVGGAAEGGGAVGGDDTEADQEQDAVSRARRAATRFGCVVLLKGAPSVVADPDGSVRVDTQASSDLAVAGMGDALTGVCGALLAQGLAPGVAASVALYCTGRAAAIAGRGVALTPSDVIRWLPDATVEVGTATTDLDLPFVLYDADPAR